MVDKEYLSEDELELVTGGKASNSYKAGDKVLYKYGNVTKSSTINSIVGNKVNMANGDQIILSDILGFAGGTTSI